MAIRIVLIGLIVLSATALAIIGARMIFPPRTVVTVVEPSAPTAAPAATTVRVLVAARPLPAGTLLRGEDIAVRELAEADAAEGLIRDSAETRTELGGALVRRFLDKGEPLVLGDVLRPRDRGFLAAVLMPNRRAITVGVDAVTGAAGLIWPGDRVDLLLTQRLDERVAVLSRRVVGETVLHDVWVIAVDQQLTQGAAGASASPDGRVARTVTLEVTPEEAERVAVAAQLGRLSLTIRSMAIETADPPPARRSVFEGDVSPALAQTDPADRPVGARLRIIQGDDRQDIVFP